MTKTNEHNSELLKIFMGMAQITRCCRQDIAFCEGVTFHQFLILDAIAKEKEMNMTDLHIILSVKKSTTTRLVKPLIQSGLLKKERAQHDSRAATLVLTAAGKKIHRNVSLCLADFLKRITKNISEQRIDDVLNATKIFINAIKNSANGYTCCS
ncbi:MAG TPA: MarR family winged helix-turn-helix transcriptional regulator [Smithellaceae bacterium]|nr:MarR family winged helix-turn-helix transcriptional regulator [Smithellaceae bacterium]